MQSSVFQENTLHVFGDESVLSVSELSNVLKSTIEKNFSSVRVRGEISGIKSHSSGHTYLTLKDNDSVVNAICWRGTKLSFPLEDGVEIIARGRITVYTARSQYQLIIEEASIAGEGALLKLLNERRKKFQELGYFDKKNPIPKYPNIIGIVTSKTGAVLQDMLHRLRDRYSFCHVVIWPVNVQGAGSAEQIANAIRGFNFMTEKKPDVLIVARGGGSIEDLWPFNEEVVVRAAYDSKIPLISAIGHETDTTLIDYTADLRAPTPTAAIEFATPILSDITLQLLENSEKIRMSMKRILNEQTKRVEIIAKSVIACRFSMMGISQKFDDRIDRFVKAIHVYFDREALKLKNQKIKNLENYINYKSQDFISKASIFDKLMRSYLDKCNEKISILYNRLEQGSYKKTLEKGFCFISDKNGNTIKTKECFDRSQKSDLLITFSDGIAKY